jgi:gliding motility-associated protein GldL
MRPGTKKWKLFMAKLYGIGAAVVIMGALFKIMHWPFAGPMLVVGLSVEAVIFFFSAFEPLHEDPKWELVYPELALAHDEEFDLHAYIDEKRCNWRSRWWWRRWFCYRDHREV